MLLSVLVPLTLAVEGMWLPEDLVSLTGPLARAGYTGRPEVLADPQAAPLGAVVSLGGCTASFVSADGLIVTNHHCAVGYLQQASKDGENLVETGFYAGLQTEERWAGPQAKVLVPLRSEDVTKVMTDGLPVEPISRSLELERREKQVVADCERSEFRCRVTGFFEGSRYRLDAFQELRDVRLVAAPPDSVGNYGDQIDNWHWPRHSGDFSFLRAYTGRDGQPAEYSERNIPFRPKQHLSVATAGPKAGDFVMVAGFPGRTNRWKTAAELDRAMEVEIPSRVNELNFIEKSLVHAYEAVPALKLNLGPARQSTANRLNKLRGILLGLQQPGLTDRWRRREQGLRDWMGKNPTYAGVAAALDSLQARADARWPASFAMEMLGTGSPLFSMAMLIDERAVQRLRPDALRDSGFQERDEADLRAGVKAFQRRVEVGTDRQLFGRYLEQVLAVSPGVPELAAWVKTEGGVAAALDHLYQRPLLADRESRLSLLDRNAGQLAISTDAFLRLAVALRPYRDREHNISRELNGESTRWRPLRAAAMRQQFPELSYSDANGSLRITFGTVQGYVPADATVYGAQTTLAGLLAKAGPPPFNAPPELLSAAKSAPSQVVNFLADLDITGGNSGSPTLNAEGRLVGLVFDGVWEGVASDWIYDPAHNRSIHVDISYVRWYLQNVMHADRVLTELEAP